MYSSRMHTARFSGHPGGCAYGVSAYGVSTVVGGNNTSKAFYLSANRSLLESPSFRVSIVNVAQGGGESNPCTSLKMFGEGWCPVQKGEGRAGAFYYYTEAVTGSYTGWGWSRGHVQGWHYLRATTVKYNQIEFLK